MASSINLEVYTLVLKTLQDGPFNEAAHVLANELEKLLPQRYDYTGKTHKITLDEHLKKFPHINGQTLLKICEKLKHTLDKQIPPSVNESSLLGDGHQSLLRSTESLRLESVGHAAKSLLASNHYLLQSNHTVNICKSIRANKVRGFLGSRNTIPTEFYQRHIRYKRVLCHLSPVYCVAFDRTGQYIFTGADDNLIKIWNAKDGRLLSTLRGHSGEITDISVDYENRLLASGSVDRLIRVWDLRTTKMIECLSTHTAMITSVKFSPYNRQGKERWLVSTANDGCISFWKYSVDDLKFPNRPIKINERIKPGGQMVCSSISMGGSFLACGSSDFFVRVYGWHHSINSPYKDLEIELHTDQVDSLQFCNRGYRFVSGSKDGFAIIWSYFCKEWHPIRLDMRTRLNEVAEETTQQDAEESFSKGVKVSMIGWTSDDAYVITSLSDNSIKVWDSYTGKLIHILKEHTEETYIIESHPSDPRIFLSAGHDGRIILWDVEKGKPIKSFHNTIEGQGHASIYDCKFSPNGQMFAATDSHGHLSLYGLGSPKPYDALPDQVFFHSDYRPLIRDVNGFAMDEQTHVAPYLMPPPTLVDMNGDPHEDRYQRLVPDFRGDGKRIDVIPPMSDSELKYHNKLIESYGIAESEAHLREMNKEGKKKKTPAEHHIPPRVTRQGSRRRPAKRLPRQTARRSNHLLPRNVVEERNNESFNDSSTSSSSDDSDYVLPPIKSRRSRRRRKVATNRRPSRVSHRQSEPGPSRRIQEEDDEATEIDDEATDIDDGDQTDIISQNGSTYNTRQSRYSQRKRRKKTIIDI